MAIVLTTAFACYLFTAAAVGPASIGHAAQAHEPTPSSPTDNELPPATTIADATGTPDKTATPTAASPHAPSTTTTVAPGETPAGLDPREWREIQQQIDADQRSFRRDTANLSILAKLALRQKGFAATKGASR